MGTFVDIPSSFGRRCVDAPPYSWGGDIKYVLLILGDGDIYNNVPSSLGEGRKCLPKLLLFLLYYCEVLNLKVSQIEG